MGPHKTWVLGVEESIAQEQLGLLVYMGLSRLGMDEIKHLKSVTQ